MIGTTIAHYNILEKLGEGGMGIVYKALDNKLHRTVALKFISPELTSNHKANERFIYEAQTASALDHQNISTIYEIDKLEDGRMFISMAYYKGETLSHVISKSEISITKALRIAIQIAEGLSKAHEKGIVHKDIKPANIIINEDGTVKIIDFGLSKLVNMLGELDSEVRMGTIHYMSPEAIRGKALNHQTDIWSLGILIYEMLTGSKPFDGKFNQEIIFSILTEKPKNISEFRSDIPTKLENIISKALEKDIQKRFKDIKELLGQLKVFYTKLFDYKNSALRNDMQKYSIRSIAVLPLVNLSNNPEEEYFTDGMTDLLITELSKILNIKIISRTSVMLYKSTEKSIIEIADELNVNGIVEGSLIRSGNTIKLTVKLIHAFTDTHIWAETYERNLSDIFILQSELVRDIAREIKITLSKKEEQKITKTRSANPKPYDYYMRGSFHLYKTLPADYEKALEYFNLALLRDPNFALAYTGIAKVWLVRNYWSIAPSKESILHAKNAVLSALRLDDTLVEGHDVMARINYFYDWNWDAAEKEFNKAIEINPNYAESYLFYSALLRTMKRNEEASFNVQKGLELDPISAFSQGFIVANMLHRKQFDAAIRKLRDILKTELNSPYVHRYLWIAYHQREDYDKALEEARKYFLGIGKTEISDLFALRYSELGYQGVMNLVADKLKELSSKIFIQPIWIARLYAYANKNNLAVKWLQIAYKQRDPLLVNLGISHDWNRIRDNVLFKNIMQEMKLN